MAALVSLISNLGLLALAATLFFVCISRFGWPHEDNRRRILIGVVFGAMSVLVVKVPIAGPFGASFDTRAAPIVLAGFYGGPVGGLIAASIGAVARYSVGGPAAIGGVVSFFLYAGTGYFFYRAKQKSGDLRLDPVALVALAVLATLFVLPSFFVGQSVETGLAILGRFWHVLALGNLVGIVVLGLLVEQMLAVAAERDQHRLDSETSRLARQAAGVGVWRYDFRNDELSWDAIEHEVMGTSPADFRPTYASFREFVHKDDIDAFERAFEAARHSGARFDCRFRIRTPTGALRHIRAQANFFGNRKDDPDLAIGVNIDETRLIDAQLEAEQARDQFQAVIASAPIAILTVGPDQRIATCNDMAEALFSRSRDGLVGERFTKLLAPVHAPQYDARFLAYFDKGDARGAAMSQEVQAVRGDGEDFPVLLGIGALAFGDNRSLVASLIDLTAQKAAESQLRRAQRLEAVGQLTGGVAHDFNNILVAISGNADLLECFVGEDEKARRHLASIHRATERAAALTSRLLAYSRKQTLAPKSTDVNALIAGLEDMLHRTLGETIDLSVSAAPDLWPATMDPHQFENALLNLAVNARDACGAGGKLLIETANTTLDAAYTQRYDDVVPGDYVKVSVSDTGTGMPQDVREKVFEPFFTTKEVGEGSGLGLSMVYGFVKQSKGHVTVHSDVGQGTTITLYLPRSSDDAQRPAPPEVETAFPKGKGRVLIVEDDPDVLEVPAVILEHQGYEIVQATDGEQAIERLKDGETFDLLFTDVVLPKGRSGLDVAREAGRLQPNIKVLFTTGYSEKVLQENKARLQEMNMLNKPYRRTELLEAVQALLHD